MHKTAITQDIHTRNAVMNHTQIHFLSTIDWQKWFADISKY